MKIIVFFYIKYTFSELNSINVTRFRQQNSVKFDIKKQKKASIPNKKEEIFIKKKSKTDKKKGGDFSLNHPSNLL